MSGIENTLQSHGKFGLARPGQKTAGDFFWLPVSLHLRSSQRRHYPRDQLQSEKDVRRGWRTDEAKTLIKTSSAGICCLTAVYIFTQACIIMVCLVCRSSQKLFRSPGVWKAFKHFIQISPLWYKIHAWAKENRRDKHNNWHLLTNFFKNLPPPICGNVASRNCLVCLCMGGTRSYSYWHIIYFTSPKSKITAFKPFDLISHNVEHL